MTTGVWLAISFCALLSMPTPPPTLTLRDGRVFYLKRVPHTERGRLVFTTTEGKTYSLDPKEVRSLVNAPPTATRTPRTWNPQDSRALGAIARQERQRDGKTTELSGSRETRRTVSPSARTRARTPARTRTPKAAPKPTPTAHS